MASPSKQPRRDNDRQTTVQQGAPASQPTPELPTQDEIAPAERSAISQGASDGADRKSSSQRTSSREDSDENAADDDKSDVDRSV